MGALTDKYCIVGVGETPHMRPSNRTTLSMACEAVKKAMADAGLEPRDVDGMTSYQAGDSTSSNHVSTALGIRSLATLLGCLRLGIVKPLYCSAR